MLAKSWVPGQLQTRLKKIYRYITEDFFEAICTALSEYADPDLARVSF